MFVLRGVLLFGYPISRDKPLTFSRPSLTKREENNKCSGKRSKGQKSSAYVEHVNQRVKKFRILSNAFDKNETVNLLFHQ